jgi:hypothetical protein
MSGKMLLVGPEADLAIRKLVNYTLVLNERYVECDGDGHKKPDTVSGTCGHCYRHLKYDTPETDRILEEREGLPPIHMPLDAPWLLEKRNMEIDIQETHDFYQGISKLREELEAEANV